MPFEHETAQGTKITELAKLPTDPVVQQPPFPVGKATLPCRHKASTCVGWPSGVASVSHYHLLPC